MLCANTRSETATPEPQLAAASPSDRCAAHRQRRPAGARRRRPAPRSRRPPRRTSSSPARGTIGNLRGTSSAARTCARSLQSRSQPARSGLASPMADQPRCESRRTRLVLGVRRHRRARSRVRAHGRQRRPFGAVPVPHLQGAREPPQRRRHQFARSASRAAPTSFTTCRTGRCRSRRTFPTSISRSCRRWPTRSRAPGGGTGRNAAAARESRPTGSSSTCATSR